MERLPYLPPERGPAWRSRAATVEMAKTIREALVLSHSDDWSPDAGPGALLEELLG